jgi:sigma-B regulation protein RsbU (phosphoserine phosphatase)
MEGVEFEEGNARLAPGDLLYLFTDGIVEAENTKSEFFEEKRLMDFLRAQLEEITPEKVVTGAQKFVEEFAGDAEQFDDMTQLALQYRPVNNRLTQL